MTAPNLLAFVDDIAPRRGLLVEHLILQSLTLDFNDEMISACGRVVKALPSLKSLDICGPSPLAQKVAISLSQSARASLRSLKIGGDTYHRPGKLTCGSAASLIDQLPSLVDLHLHLLTPDGAAALGKTLPSLTVLTILVVDQVYGLDPLDLGGVWSSPLTAISFSLDSPQLPELAALVHAHRQSLSSLNLHVDVDAPTPLQLDLPRLNHLLLEIPCTPPALSLLAAFDSSPLLRLTLMVWATVDEFPRIAEAVDRAVMRHKGTLKELSLEVYTERMSEADESAMSSLKGALNWLRFEVKIELHDEVA